MLGADAALQAVISGTEGLFGVAVSIASQFLVWFDEHFVPVWGKKRFLKTYAAKTRLSFCIVKKNHEVLMALFLTTWLMKPRYYISFHYEILILFFLKC